MSFFCVFLEMIWKIQKKSKLNGEKIWKLWKKSKLNSEKIWKIWKKSKLNREKIEYGRKISCQFEYPAHGEVYLIQHSVIKFVSDLRQVRGFTPVSSINKTGRHDITEILLKVALNTRTHNPL
jgi:hypothetical protein